MTQPQIAPPATTEIGAQLDRLATLEKKDALRREKQRARVYRFRDRKREAGK